MSFILGVNYLKQYKNDDTGITSFTDKLFYKFVNDCFYDDCNKVVDFSYWSIVFGTMAILIIEFFFGVLLNRKKQIKE